MNSSVAVAEVAESSFALLQIEAVNMWIADAPKPADYARAARQLEAVGFHVGHRLAELVVKDRPRFDSTLEVIKFICKDFWYEVYRKQIDKLQTNNRGVYMLQDNRHRMLSRCSPSLERQASAKQLAGVYAKYSSGLIRGALHGLGVIASVAVEVPELAAAHFTIRIQQALDSSRLGPI
jgi:hypothetical protein